MNEELHPECPIRNIIARFTDKWSLLILYTLNLHPVDPVFYAASLVSFVNKLERWGVSPDRFIELD